MRLPQKNPEQQQQQQTQNNNKKKKKHTPKNTKTNPMAFWLAVIH